MEKAVGMGASLLAYTGEEEQKQEAEILSEEGFDAFLKGR